MKSVNILGIIYISFYSLTSRTREMTHWWADCKEKFIAMEVFCVLEVTFYSLI